MMGLCLELRGSRVFSTAVAAKIPSLTGAMLSLVRSASCDEHGWSRQDGVEAGSGCDGPGGEAVESCCRPEPLGTVVAETSSRIAVSVGVSAMVGKQLC